MEFRQIQYFVCLYEEGSVTRAARRLNIVQPALSMQIAKLEEELGQSLFLRSRQGMQPTPEGRQMYRLFMPVLGDFARAREQLLHRDDGELVGELRLGMIATVSQGVLVDAMLEFSAAHPKVHLSLTDGYSGGLIDAVAEGRLNAAIINQPRRPLALNTEPIVGEGLLLVTGTAHAPLPAEVPFHSLAGMKLVLPTRQHGLRGVIESFAESGDVSLEPRVEIDSISAIVKAVVESSYATLLPRIAVARQIESGQLSGHRVVAPELARQLVCITHPRRPPGPAAAAFIATMVRHLRRGASALEPGAPPAG